MGPKDFLSGLFNKRYADYANFFNDILEPLFYEALATPDREGNYYSRFNCKIPFLNGGLFDPMGGYNWVNVDLPLPNELFSNKTRTPEGDEGDGVLEQRIFHLTKLGRETPNVPCTVFFEEAEWKALYSYVEKNPIPPEKPPTLREAIHMTASLGGFLGRKSDGEPGTQSLWLGIQRLDDLTAMWKFMVANFAPHLLIPPVSSNPGYG